MLFPFTAPGSMCNRIVRPFKSALKSDGLLLFSRMPLNVRSPSITSLECLDLCWRIDNMFLVLVKE